MTSVGLYTFRGCTNLKNVTIPYRATSIGQGTFYGCTGLTNMTIPDSVTSIGSSAFSGCSGLTSVTIGNGVTSIANYAFQDCSGLTSMAIPDSVTSIGLDAFSGCNNALFDTTTIPGLKLVDGWVAGTTASPSGSLDLTGALGIGASTFSSCTSLTSVTIGNTMKIIGTSAFLGCSGLTGALTIPDNVTKINSTAFKNCSNLTSVTIGNGVTSLPGANVLSNGVFAGCSSLTSVTIGSGMTSISANTFRDCSSCKIFDFRRVVVVPSLDGVSAFYNTPSDKEIIVPDVLYDEWVAATNWSSDTNNVRPCIVKASQSSLGTL